MTKTRIYIWLLLLSLFLLTACQAGVTDCKTEPEESTAPSSSITTPSSSAAPTVGSIPTTSALTTSPNSSTGYAHIYDEDSGAYWKEYDFSDCIEGYLYWMDKKTHKVTLILAEQIVDVEAYGAYIYYVKEAEPSKIYRLSIADPSQQKQVHETTHGAVRAIMVEYTMENYLQYIAGSQKFIIFDLDTGEETVLMEQHYLDFGYIQKESDGSMSNWILFTGQPTEDSPYTDYTYNRITGEVAIEQDSDCDCEECV